MTRPLLTVAIPTWNRAPYLEQNLSQLLSETAMLRPDLVEILVSDNASTDETAATVEKIRQSGLVVRYVRNERNMGWAFNFAQCFDLAVGKYVVLLGDDDVFVNGALATVL